MYLIDDSDEHADRRAADDERRRKLGLVRKSRSPTRRYIPSSREGDQEAPEEVAMRTIQDNLAQYIV